VLEIPEHISKLADERQTARKDKNWQLADEIRDELLSRGYEVEDTRDGPRINKT
jgi:cysteinyl-tRNA synthetase